MEDGCLTNMMRAGDTLTREQERELGRRIQRGDREALDELVRCNTRLVVHLAKRFRHRHRSMDLDDLIGHGLMGLIAAAERYDPSYSNRFSTYASHHVHMEMGRGSQRECRTIRYPAYVQDLLNEVKIKGLEGSGVDGIVKGTGCAEGEAKILVKVLSYEWEGLGDVAVDDPPDAKVEADDEAMVERARDIRLWGMVDMLDKRARRVIRERFLYGLSLKDVGVGMGMTKENVRLIQCRALRELRSMMGVTDGQASGADRQGRARRISPTKKVG